MSNYDYGNDEWQSALEETSTPIKKTRGWARELLWVSLGIILVLGIAAVWHFGFQRNSDDSEITPLSNTDTSSASEISSARNSSSEENTAESLTSGAATTEEPTSSEPEPVSEESAAVSASDRCNQGYWPSGFTRPTVQYCDGQWMRIGSAQTDHVEQYYWNSGAWQEYSFDGKTDIGDFGCYEDSRLDRDGVPAELRNKLIICEQAKQNAIAQGVVKDNSVPDAIRVASNGQSSENVACDGRYILIVQSVIDSGNREATKSEIGSALNEHSGSVFTAPGNCSSLRKSVNGSDIYPIYIDFGSDVESACRAKSVRGGNVRTLNTTGDFSDPC